MAALLPAASASPPSHVHLLTVLLRQSVPHRQVVIAAAADNADAVSAYDALQSRFEPFTTVIFYDGSAQMDAMFEHMTNYKTDAPFAAYVCENFTCRQPVDSAQALLEALAIQSDGTPGQIITP